MTAYRCPLSDDDCWNVRKAQGNLGGHAPACYGLPFQYWRDVPRNRAGNLRGMIPARPLGTTAASAARTVLESVR